MNQFLFYLKNLILLILNSYVLSLTDSSAALFEGLIRAVGVNQDSGTQFIANQKLSRFGRNV